MVFFSPLTQICLYQILCLCRARIGCINSHMIPSQILTVESNLVHHFQFITVLTRAMKCVHYAEILIHRRIIEQAKTCPLCRADNFLTCLMGQTMYQFLPLLISFLIFLKRVLLREAKLVEIRSLHDAEKLTEKEKRNMAGYSPSPV